MLLFLLIAVLAPTACVLWFMSEVSKGQVEAARQSVREAYRNQFDFVRDRVDEFWNSRAAALDAQASGLTAADFHRIVAAGSADSVVFLDESGAVRYPTPIALPAPDPALSRPFWQAIENIESMPGRLPNAAAAYARIAASETDLSIGARAAQGQVRCLLMSGNKPAALQAIESQFLKGRFAIQGEDPQHRLIAVDELLLSLNLLQPQDGRYRLTANRLATLLNDYDSIVMPSSQRLFLIDKMQALFPDGRYTFPMADAERLAAKLADAEGPILRGPRNAIGDTALPETFRLTSPSGRVIAIYRTATVSVMVASVLHNQNTASVRFVVKPPDGARARDENSIPASATMPGWRIAYSMLGPKPAEEAAHRRIAIYTWVGFLVIAVSAIAALLAARSFQQQARIARMKADLVATVSHELKTPLSSMRLLVDALLQDEHFDPVKTREYLELTAGENLRLTRLIENFLTYSRIERNRQHFEFAEINPADVVYSAARVMHDRLPASEPSLAVEVSNDLPPIRADEDALVTALLNLLDNAHKYTPDEKRISLCAYRDESHLILAVKDNGIGIPPREQKHVFGAFYQVDRRLARETGGCGLGLSIVTSIVKAHGGVVELSSKIGAGSTFRIVLPLPRASGARA